jgi:hypothetical protein
MITYINKNINHLESLGPLNLPTISETPLMYVNKEGDLHTDKSRRVLINNDTGSVINVVKKSYSYENAQYSDGERTVQRILLDSGINLQGVTRAVRTSHNGARAAIIYTMPQYVIDLGKGDQTLFQLAHYNSFDGSWCFTIEVGAIRMLCTNGQVAIDGFCMYKSKHTPSLSADHAARKVTQALKTFEAEGERWKRWRDKTITDVQAFKIFAEAAACKPALASSASIYEMMMMKDVYMNRNLMYMWHQYTNNEQPLLGSNEWAAYNAMTHWSTHAPAGKKTDNILDVNVRRQALVRVAASHRLAA